MKRYRILNFGFDHRVHNLERVPEQWNENEKKRFIENQKRIIENLKAEYGEWYLGTKVENFIDLKVEPFSVAAFHNRFLKQIRNAYVIGSYYPALTGACALGERILNHMMILLRDYHKGTPEYQKVYRLNSFQKWPLAIDTLESWSELLPEAASKFRDLNEKRNYAIHFNPETDHNDKELALEAIHLIQDIVSVQFSPLDNPWLFCVSGECYIKKEWENKPLIRHLFIPNSIFVGPKHELLEKTMSKLVVNDQFEYEDKEITDEEFKQLRQSC